jgi:hypothetical protein
MRGFFPFGCALGQNDKREQKQIPCGNDKQVKARTLLRFWLRQNDERKAKADSLRE